MNIRKIIKEEIDDFDWVDPINDSDIHIGTCLETQKGFKYVVDGIDGDSVKLKDVLDDRILNSSKEGLELQLMTGELMYCL